MTSWEEELKAAFEETGDDFSKMKTTLTAEELKEEFDDGYGSSNGKPFIAWGEKYVYFPAVYDGSKLVEWVSSNPCDEVTGHVGGE